jgi:hypothetical protein
MPISISILLLGRDPGLLETRRWVLETAGYTVRTMSAWGDLEVALAAETADILILCHSVSVREREPTISIVRSRHPAIEILTLNGARSYPPPVRVQTLVRRMDP